MAEIYDISVPIFPGMVVWPGDPPVSIRQLSQIGKGDQANVSQIRMSVHTGTHIDAPRHFIQGGKTVTDIPLDRLMGEALVVELGKDVVTIDRQVLESHPQLRQIRHASKLLFKTRNSDFWADGTREFRKDYVGLDASGAEFLSTMNLGLIGLDYLSVAAFDETQEPHQILMREEIVLLEGVDLSAVPPGIYQLYCLPLKIAECEGAPARAILKTVG